MGGDALGANLAVDAPLVFVGFGVMAPEHGRDDYRGPRREGQDRRRAESGAPKFLQTEERAYYRSTKVKLAAAQARGAIGHVSGQHPDRGEALSLRQCRAPISQLGHDLAQAGRQAVCGVALAGLGRDQRGGRAKLFGRRYGTRFWLPPKPRPAKCKAMPCRSRCKAELHSEIKTVESKNIVGLLPGSDPKLKNEYVVLSAHLDHIGITPPVNGDSHQQWRHGQCVRRGDDPGSGAICSRPRRRAARCCS